MRICLKNCSRTATSCFTFLFFSALTGCASEYRGLVEQGRFASSVGVVPHYGRGIGIPNVYLNGGYVGTTGGWGSGSGDQCCVSMKIDNNKPLMVTVKWETYRSNVNERRWHEETIPVNFAVPPGEGSRLNVHLLPGHHVQVWYSMSPSFSPKYPGPAYTDKSTYYIPLADEKPNPSEK